METNFIFYLYKGLCPANIGYNTLANGDYDDMKYSLCITSPEISKPFAFSMMGGSFEKKLSDMKAFGYSAIELLPGFPKECDVEYVRRICRENGLAVSDISSGAITTVTGFTLLNRDRTVRKEAAAVFSDMIDLASRFGVGVVTIGAFRGWAKDVGTVEDGYSVIAELLSSVDGKLRDNDVKVALEPVNRGQTDIFNTCDETLSFIDRCGSANVGVLYDTYNAYMTEDDPAWALKSVLTGEDSLLHFHIADSDRLIPGEGKIDFLPLLRLLKECGYDGYLSGELNRGDDPTMTGKKIIEAMQRFEECI